MVKTPLMVTVEQCFPSRELVDVRAEVKKALAGATPERKIVPGEVVAITAGSRGINNLVTILGEVVDWVKTQGARPVIVAAMGSHGGGTVEGQISILERLGITPDSMGAPVVASAESIPLEGTKALVNRIALDCRHIIVVNRIKPHTSFHGRAESGLQKMLAVGLGGPSGAASIHSMGAEALPEVIPAISRQMIERLPVTLGLAILEDAHENTMKVVAVEPRLFVQKEEDLLNEARIQMPRLPVKELDLLIVEQMGKVFSGTGIDTNVIGRLRIEGIPEPAWPSIKRIVVLDLAPGGHGNANGIGLADFTTKKLVNKINFDATYLNVITSTFVIRAMLPVTMPDDRSAIETALRSLGAANSETARIMRIKNTLHLSKIQVSANLLEELKNNPIVKITGHPAALEFDRDGNLLPF